MFGRSNQAFGEPRLWWFSFGLGEVTVYRWGIHLYVGPSRCFLSAAFGTETRDVRLVRCPD